MKYRDILASATRVVCEDDENGNCSDYEERATYLLATFCAECASLDKQYRAANRLPSLDCTFGVCVELEDSFPLSDIFAHAAVYYLSAMLVLEENENMSEQLFARYTDFLETLRQNLPAKSAPILNCYP